MDWRPVEPAELALKRSTIDANADAEELFRDVWIDEHATTNYVRLKIFTDRGREEYSNVRLEYSGRSRISDVSARTIHSDGTIIDLAKDAIIDQVEAKAGSRKIKQLSFAMPKVEVGSLIEYRWTENDRPALSAYLPLDVQQEYPVDEATFHIRPLGHDSAYGSAMRFRAFGCQFHQSYSDAKGFTTVTVRNIAGYRDEPFSPPELSLRKWILAYYDEDPVYSGLSFWNFIGRQEYKEAKGKIKVNGEMQQFVASLISKGKSDEEKLAMLADYCRQNIKDVSSSTITVEELDRFRPNKNSVETFQRRIGTARDIDLTFIALAQAAGYAARLALVADRRAFLFNPKIESTFFLDNYDAAVQLNGQWKFYDVSDEWAPPGTLAWREQGVYALILDPEKPEWVTTSTLSAEETRIERIAEFTLSDDGDLEGSVHELYWGNEAIIFRKAHSAETPSERVESMSKKLKATFRDVSLEGIRVTMSPNAKLPAGLVYHLQVKNYAEHVGTRLILRPGVFSTGTQPYFTSAERTNEIYFPYPWSEWDSVTIKLPKGFQLEHAESPAPLNFSPVGKYLAKIFVNSATNTLTYERALTIGSSQPILLGPDVYAKLKTAFDMIHSSDQEAVTLKTSVTAGQQISDGEPKK